MPDDKRKNLVTILLTTCHSSRKMLMMRKVASLLGLVANLALTTQWVKFTHTALQRDVTIALKLSSNAVFASGKFNHLTYLITSKK